MSEYRSSGGGCLTGIIKLCFWILAISFIISKCSGDDPADHKSTTKPTPSAEVAEEKSASELSERAEQIEDFYFHGYYTDLGYVDIHEFDKRDTLLSKMEVWLEQVKVGEGKFLDLDIRPITGNYYKICDDWRPNVYIGETKNGRPDGWGIILRGKETSTESPEFGEWPDIVYAGEFDDGRFDGYGASFCVKIHNAGNAVVHFQEMTGVDDNTAYIYSRYLTNHVNYEGKFSDGKRNGKGNLFDFDSAMSEIYIPQNLLEDYVWGFAYPNVTKGEFKNGKLDGKVKEYRYNELFYEGRMKNGEYAEK